MPHQLQIIVKNLLTVNVCVTVHQEDSQQAHKEGWQRNKGEGRGLDLWCYKCVLV